MKVLTKAELLSKGITELDVRRLMKASESRIDFYSRKYAVNGNRCSPSIQTAWDSECARFDLAKRTLAAFTEVAADKASVAPVPLFKAPNGIVYHIGEMELAGKRTNSLEGHCLSVSLVPHAWRQIARIGGRPLMGLRRIDEQAPSLVDMRALGNQPELQDEIALWGKEQGLCVERDVWRAWRINDDNEWCYSQHEGSEQAFYELDIDELSDDIEIMPNGNRVIECVATLVGTDALMARVGCSDLASRDAFDYVALAWVEDTRPELDGVWWHEKLDPIALSAPRGGILPTRLSAFVASPCEWNAVLSDDDDPDADHYDYEGDSPSMG